MSHYVVKSIAAREAKISFASPPPSPLLQAGQSLPGGFGRFGRPPEPPPVLPGINLASYRLDMLAAGAPPPRKFLLDPLIPLATAGVLFGPGSVGKSMVAFDLCLSVAMQAIAKPGHLNFVPGPLGGTVPQAAGGAAVFLTLEDDTAEVQRRAWSLDPTGEMRASAPLYVIPAVDLPGFDPELVRAEGRNAALTTLARDGLDDLLARVRTKSGFPVRLLVLDPAGDFVSGDENDASFIKPIMRRMREIAASHGCAVMLLGHIAKGIDAGTTPTMRGSGAWIANSRFAYALWKIDSKEAGSIAERVGVPAPDLVWGCLSKANHNGAPVDSRRLFQRGNDGRLNDITHRLRGDAGLDDPGMVDALVLACCAAAEAGTPYTMTGHGGLFARRKNLPEPLAGLSRAKLLELGNDARERGKLVKIAGSGGVIQYLGPPMPVPKDTGSAHI